MTLLVPLMMFGWIPFTIYLFTKYSSYKAVVISVIGGVLFLPVASYELLGFPDFSKEVAIALSLLLGYILTKKQKAIPTRISSFDIPILLWCLFCPIATSLSNNLGIYDGLSTLLTNTFRWGVYYWAGRKFFYSVSSLRYLAVCIVISGIIYTPFLLYEIRMSPQLSNILYGFFPHSFAQHIRYGGFRPIVFMEHGLMVSLWMASTYTIAFWFLVNKVTKKIFKIPISLVVILLVIITVMCKSANGWIYLLIGTFCTLLYRKKRNTFIIRTLLLLVPVYIIVRLLNIIPINFIESIAAKIFDDERIGSLAVRLVQENLFGSRTMERPLFGWGGYNRGWPTNPYTGELLIDVVDSLFVIISNQFGLFGLFSVFLSLLIGPMLILRKKTKNTISFNYQNDSIVLSLIVILFCIDSLMNGLHNPIFILTAGALISYHIHVNKGLE